MELRQQFLDFVKARADQDRRVAKSKAQEDLLHGRFEKLKKNTEYRLLMIEEFKKTLNNLDWNKDIREAE